VNVERDLQCTRVPEQREGNHVSVVPAFNVSNPETPSLRQSCEILQGKRGLSGSGFATDDHYAGRT
jgi:hypothetical protein